MVESIAGPPHSESICNRMDIQRCSLNAITLRSLNLNELITGATTRRIQHVAPWIETIDPIGAREAKKFLDDHGITVSSLCRSGFFPASTHTERIKALDQVKRDIESAAVLEAGCLAIVAGGIPAKPKNPKELAGSGIQGARDMVRTGLESVVDYAGECGVALGLEPLHPMMAADRCVICSLTEANDLIETIDHPSLGLLVDAYHVWHDAQLEQQVQRASGRILGLHLSDWVLPITDHLGSRGMIGDGIIDLRGLIATVDKAGYHGPIEVEILSNYWWSQPPDLVLDTIVNRWVLL